MELDTLKNKYQKGINILMNKHSYYRPVRFSLPTSAKNHYLCTQTYSNK